VIPKTYSSSMYKTNCLCENLFTYSTCNSYEVIITFKLAFCLCNCLVPYTCYLLAQHSVSYSKNNLSTLRINRKRNMILNNLQQRKDSVQQFLCELSINEHLSQKCTQKGCYLKGCLISKIKKEKNNTALYFEAFLAKAAFALVSSPRDSTQLINFFSIRR
jgi:hypothetical protein